MAREAGLESVQFRAEPASPPVLFPDGRSSSVLQRSLEISGRDAYEKVDRFLALLALSPRPVDVQALRITPAASNTVTFQARIAFPVVGLP